MKNVIKMSALALAFAVVTGCGVVDRFDAKLTGAATVCVEGVSYIQFTSGASVQYNKDGTIKTCQ